MAIIGLGLLPFALLIGNMQTFLQALGQRRLRKTLKLRDVERWMCHRSLPEDLRRQVRKAERYNWAATRGIKGEELIENLPENIRHHLFKFLKKVRIFSRMNDHVLDALCERIKQAIYIEDSIILYPGVAIERMIFIARGKLESSEEKETSHLIRRGCLWRGTSYMVVYRAIFSKQKYEVRSADHRLLSIRTVRCLTNVEAFAVGAKESSRGY
ncbi:hypothetical protein L6164_018760 [Bauhinia variegata]|uniref:Uncharacterized protein n=1 Tax=Bauhinia variegata TaxID=167791 RepID=A0ACB9NCF9_BAUVA|nr:hypothetical protein L6164_018760 [Bauhinia variegata]